MLSFHRIRMTCGLKVSSVVNPFRLTSRDDTAWLASSLTPYSTYFNTKGGGVPVSSQLLIEKDRQEVRVTTGKTGSPRVEVENLLSDINNIKTAEKLGDVLESANLGRVDDRDMNALFGALFRVIRYETSDTAKKQLLNSVGMQKLFKIVRHYCRYLNVAELITIVKFMSFLNTAGSNSTLQTILRLISTQANSMTTSEIIYVSFLLEKIGPSTVVAALKMALPVIFESQITTKLDMSDASQLCDALHYAVKYNLSDDSVQSIIDGLIEQGNNLSPRQNMSVIWSIADSRRKIPHQELLVAPALKNLTSSFEYFSEDELNTTILKLSKKFTKNSPYFYNEDLMTKYCQFLTAPERDPSRILFGLRAITQMRHVDIEYLDRVGQVILCNPSLLLNNDFAFSAVLRAFSGANYKPETWDKIEPILLNHPFLTKDVELASMALVVDFLSLGCFPEKLISKIFSPSSFSLLDQYVKFHSAYIPLLILKSIKFICPEYNGPLPPASMVKDWQNSVIKIPKTYSLKPALQSGIGGTTYVLSGLFHEGFHIDHAIAFRKGGYPVALDVEEPVVLEELQLPTESEIVMVKALMPESYATNTNRLRGVYAHELRLIENLGHCVIAIDTARWKELPDSEKIPFLMHRIREKSELTTRL